MRRVALGLLPLVGCTDGAPGGVDSTAVLDTADSAGDSAASPGTWTVGDAEACAAPVAAHWTDHAADLWDITDYPASKLRTDTACVGFESRPEGWRAWATGVDAELYRHDLTTAETVTYAVPHLSVRMVMDDFDADGEDDVGVFLIDNALLWGGTDTPVPLPGGVQVAYADAPMDLDGDGLDELVVLGLGGDAELAPAPQVLHNDGGRAWGAPVAESTGGVGMAFSSRVIDWDGDGDPDVLQCNDFGSIQGGNVVLVDEGGALEVGDARGADLVANCMSASFGDVNADGRLDLYVAQNGPQRLLLDEGDIGYVDAAEALISVGYTGTQMGWSGVVVDADNDGRADILLSTSDFARNPRGDFPVWWLAQGEDGRFTESGAAAGLPQSTASRGLVLRDVNADGVVDALVGDIDRPPRLMLSDGCTAGAWVEVTAPAGSLVTVEAGGHTRAALASRQDGWCGWGPPIAHVGLGDATHIDRITVKAPWHDTAWITDVPVRTRLTWRP